MDKPVLIEIGKQLVNPAHILWVDVENKQKVTLIFADTRLDVTLDEWKKAKRHFTIKLQTRRR